MMAGNRNVTILRQFLLKMKELKRFQSYIKSTEKAVTEGRISGRDNIVCDNQELLKSI